MERPRWLHEPTPRRQPVCLCLLARPARLGPTARECLGKPCGYRPMAARAAPLLVGGIGTAIPPEKLGANISDRPGLSAAPRASPQRIGRWLDGAAVAARSLAAGFGSIVRQTADLS